jgi:hypothetical protein
MSRAFIGERRMQSGQPRNGDVCPRWASAAEVVMRNGRAAACWTGRVMVGGLRILNGLKVVARDVPSTSRLADGPLPGHGQMPGTAHRRMSSVSTLRNHRPVAPVCGA